MKLFKTNNMKKIYQCPQCGAILLRNVDTKKTFWQELDLNELVAMKTIQQSIPLLVITGKLLVIPTECDNCYNLENPFVSLN